MRPQNTKDPTKHTIYKCITCGKTFEDLISIKRKYCSIKCAANNRKPKLRTIRISLRCKWCGKEYVRRPSELKKKPSNYCSHKCMYACQAIARQDCGNANYKGENAVTVTRGHNWITAAKQARIRDHNTCQLCGKKGWVAKERIEVHHIKPYRTFNGDYKNANCLNNLITLCRACHVGVECGRLSL